MKISLAYYRGESIQHRLIRWFTGSAFSHVEYLDLRTIMCWSSSSKEGGVRKKFINLANGKWTIVHYDLPFEVDPLDWFEEHEGCKYSWNSILNYVWYMFTELESEYNCSVAIARALGFHFDRITPRELFEFLAPYRETTVEFPKEGMVVTRHPKGPFTNSV
jgi:hypothetical protein